MRNHLSCEDESKYGPVYLQCGFSPSPRIVLAFTFEPGKSRNPSLNTVTKGS